MRHLLLLLLVVFTTAPYLAHGEESVSLEVLGNLADNGDPEAQYKMGLHHIYGTDVGKKDIKQALELFIKSSAQGYAPSLYILGKLYMDGIYIKKSDKKAIQWYEKAARKGHKESQYALAFLLSRYHDSNQLLVKSYAWFSVVSKRGIPKASNKRDELAKNLDVFEILQAKRLAADYYENYVVPYDENAKSEYNEDTNEEYEEGEYEEEEGNEE